MYDSVVFVSRRLAVTDLLAAIFVAFNYETQDLFG